ncbi:MAG: hypothetical protein OEV37_01775 [Candidatus Berkelbacteria bacterium]|nr:hypothetical protein [Candidatus Berkelbacteria bacterium]
MSQNKTCKQCNEQFIVEDEDLEFYKKIFPTFAGKTYHIPPPTLCPDCRMIRRLLWRNERALYKRKCERTGKEIVSIYSPDKKHFKVWNQDEWYKDNWDPLDFGRTYNSSESFFKQFYELQQNVPRPAMSFFNCEDCYYCNFVWNAKKCYLCWATMDLENCMYSTRSFESVGCVDCIDTRNSQHCYSCLDCENCYKARYSERCKDCSEISFCFDCRGCKNIYLCTNLRNKQYYIRNKQYSREEYFRVLEKNAGSISRGKQDTAELKEMEEKSIHPENYNLKCEDCSGDYLTECKNCSECFLVAKSESSKYILSGNQNINHSYDIYQNVDSEFSYEGIGGSGYKNIFCAWMMRGNDNYYCNFCESCSNCFGCFGLKQKQHCILNKQYSKEEYEKIVSEIIEKMSKDKEWGEYFPSWSAPFCYNETMANTWFPKSRDEAVKLDAKWQDNDYIPNYSGDYYSPKDKIEEYIGNKEEQEKMVEGVLKCEVSGKPFKIMPQELNFYIENKIAIPTKHYEVRYLERFNLRNPRKLYRRQCMCEEPGHNHEGRCKIEFEATYAPDRPEKIYCENCYQKTVI